MGFTEERISRKITTNSTTRVATHRAMVIRLMELAWASTSSMGAMTARYQCWLLPRMVMG